MRVLISPLKSHAFNPLKLRGPKAAYDLAKTLLPKRDKAGFETTKAARDEDKRRARALVKSSMPGAPELGAWLMAATKAAQLPLSCASSFYMRMARRKVIGELHRQIHAMGYKDADIHVFTLIHPKWFFRPGKLHQCDPKRLKNQLRRYLDRAGVLAVDGLLFAGFHGEYDGVGYQVHCHGVAVGQKAVELDNLLGNYGFETTKTIYRPIQNENIKDVPRQISYVLQSFWPMKKRYVDENGILRRSRKKVRVPSPCHEEILMWMARQHLQSLIISNGFYWGNMGRGKL